MAKLYLWVLPHHLLVYFLDLNVVEGQDKSRVDVVFEKIGMRFFQLSLAVPEMMMPFLMMVACTHSLAPQQRIQVLEFGHFCCRRHLQRSYPHLPYLDDALLNDDDQL
mmetsp:Transcript_26869/g.47771  ORF Transcript_26869/g.47771 Transcript_26869/m.47771 type:complete len:108 (-) Transcript_26869:162-485(-)